MVSQSTNDSQENMIAGSRRIMYRDLMAGGNEFNNVP